MFKPTCFSAVDYTLFNKAAKLYMYIIGFTMKIIRRYKTSMPNLNKLL